MPRPPRYPNRPDKHCPGCEIEYTEQATVCSDCGGELVWGALPEAVPPLAYSDELTQVSYGQTFVMNALVDKLNTAGIQHHLALAEYLHPYVGDDGVLAALGGEIAPDGGSPDEPMWRLLVRPEDEEAARQLSQATDHNLDHGYISKALADGARLNNSPWTSRTAAMGSALLMIVLGAIGHLLLRDTPYPVPLFVDTVLRLSQLSFWLGLCIEVGLVFSALIRWNDQRMKRTQEKNATA
ncbi:MAG: hypothetical protein AAF170_13550 [Bacteroidota bacterium]